MACERNTLPFLRYSCLPRGLSTASRLVIAAAHIQEVLVFFGNEKLSITRRTFTENINYFARKINVYSAEANILFFY